MRARIVETSARIIAPHRVFRCGREQFEHTHHWALSQGTGRSVR